MIGRSNRWEHTQRAAGGGIAVMGKSANGPERANRNGAEAEVIDEDRMRGSRGDVICTLQQNMYDGTWQRASLEDEFRWHRRSREYSCPIVNTVGRDFLFSLPGLEKSMFAT